jgi:hypothetical protein
MYIYAISIRNSISTDSSIICTSYLSTGIQIRDYSVFWTLSFVWYSKENVSETGSVSVLR